jgi:DNA-binding XRE family transcriptional regulator
MNSNKFGNLIAHLRKELRDEHNHVYTQDKLAQATQATRTIISNLERGSKANLEPDLLVNLANAFSLTSREREAFFLAAMGIQQEKSCQDDCFAKKALISAQNLLQNIAAPAFIVDHYDNILAANQIILTMYSYSEQIRLNAPNIFAGYNVLRFVFSSASPFSQSIVRNKEAYLMQSISFFRAISLPYRASTYYRKLIKAFNSDPDMRLFRSYYAQSAYNQDDFLLEDSRAFMAHPEFGEISLYSPAITPINTSCGSIYLISYIPADAKTAHIFGVLAEKHAGQLVHLEQFPVDQLCP